MPRMPGVGGLGVSAGIARSWAATHPHRSYEP